MSENECALSQRPHSAERLPFIELRFLDQWPHRGDIGDVNGEADILGQWHGEFSP